MAMNLGDETLREVSRSRPELVHVSSRRSIAASDDFHSLSERAVSPVSSSEQDGSNGRHDSSNGLRPPVSPLLPSREPTPPQPQHPATVDQSPDVFYMSRSTPSPSPAQPAIASDAAHVDIEPSSPNTARRHVSSEIGSGTITPRPATIVRVASDTTRPSTQHTAIRDSDTLPASDPAAFGHADIQVPQSSGAVRPIDPIGPAENATHGTPSSEPVPTSTQPSPAFRNAASNLNRALGTSTVLGNGNNSSNGGLPATTGEHPTSTNRSTGPQDRQPDQAWVWNTSKSGNPVPTPGVDPTPELQFALEQLTRDEEIRGYGRDSFIEPQTVPVAPSRATTGRARVSQLRVESGTERASSSNYSEQDAVVANTQPVAAASTASPVRASPVRSGRIDSPTAIPRIDSSIRAAVSNRYTPAALNDYSDMRKTRNVPVPIRYLPMLGLILLCAAMITVLVVSSVHTAYSGGLTRYDGTGTSLYFVYRYLPQLVAALIVLWLHETQNALQRLLPFVILSDRRAKKSSENDVLRAIQRFKVGFLLPDLSVLRHGEIGVGLCNLIFWLALFTVPLAPTVYTPVYFEGSSQAYWRWSTVQAVCWTLIALYFLLMVALIYVAIRFNIRGGALAWDPRSLADLFVLLRRGNTTFARLSSDFGKYAGYPDTRPASLGLWRSPSNINGMSYGIGVDMNAVGGTFTPPPEFNNSPTGGLNSPAPVSHFESWQSNSTEQYAWLPWFLRPLVVVIWIFLAIGLLIAFLVVSWVNAAVQQGFDPLLFAGDSGNLNFSSANFLYGFLPALLGLLCYLLWQPIDATYRALQPFVEMRKKDVEQSAGGASAEQSVLLEYNALVPFWVSVVALLNGHFRVAWLSFVTPLSMVLPVLAGGVFQAQFVVGTEDTIREIASIPGYIALCVFATIYALSYLTIWPLQKHRLPHSISTVADIADFVIGGRLLNDVVWRDPPSKTMLVTDLLGQRRLSGEKHRDGAGNFRFGEHLGLDGKPRLGIYRAL